MINVEFFQPLVQKNIDTLCIIHHIKFNSTVKLIRSVNRLLINFKKK